MRLPEDPVENWSRRRYVNKLPDQSHAGLESFRDAEKYTGLRCTRKAGARGGQFGEYTDWMLGQNDQEHVGKSRFTKEAEKEVLDPRLPHKVSRAEYEARKGYKASEIFHWGKQWDQINSSPQRLPNYRRGAECPPWVRDGGAHLRGNEDDRGQRGSAQEDAGAFSDNNPDAAYYRKVLTRKATIPGRESNKSSNVKKIFATRGVTSSGSSAASASSSSADRDHGVAEGTHFRPPGRAAHGRPQQNTSTAAQKQQRLLVGQNEDYPCFYHVPDLEEGSGSQTAAGPGSRRHALMQHQSAAQKYRQSHEFFSSARVFDCLQGSERRRSGRMNGTDIDGPHAEEGWATSEIYPLRHAARMKQGEAGGGTRSGRHSAMPSSVEGGRTQKVETRRLFRKSDFYHGVG
mmetsp:Transcript_2312/g.5421  ORF Transcript_2312/g.5421 Transcript_2312/m.5421 type:complete len:403 (+) Transcript_2312:124-1332(+)